MDWMPTFIFAVLLALVIQVLAQNGYTYQQSSKQFNGGTVRYPGTTQHEHSEIRTPSGHTDNQQPSDQQGSGGSSRNQQPNGPQDSNEYPGSQHQHRGSSIPQSSGVLVQGISSPGAGLFTGYPSGRPQGPSFRQRPEGVGPQGSSGPQAASGQQPSGSKGPNGYLDVQEPSGPQISGSYLGSQQPGDPHHSEEYSGGQRPNSPQDPQNGYPEIQRSSSSGTGPFTRYPLGRPEAPLPQRPKAGEQQLGVPQGLTEYPGTLGPRDPQGYPGSQQSRDPQHHDGYPSSQRPREPQGPQSGYPGTKQPSGSGVGPLIGYPSGRHEGSALSQRPEGVSLEGSNESQRLIEPDEPQKPSESQQPGGSQAPSGSQKLQGPGRYPMQQNAGYPSGRPQEPAIPNPQQPGVSGLPGLQGSFSRSPSLMQPGGLQVPSRYPEGHGPNGPQGSSHSQGPEGGQQKQYPDIQSPSKLPNSYIPSTGPQRSNKPQEQIKPQGPIGSQESNGPQGLISPQDPYPQISNGAVHPALMYSRTDSELQRPSEPGGIRSNEVREPSRTYLPGYVSPGGFRPGAPGFPGFPTAPAASESPGTHGGSGFTNTPERQSAPNVSGIPSVPNTPGESFPGAGRTGEFDLGKYEEKYYSAIPGEPDIDYPIYSGILETSFNCDQQQYPGYYADVETRCQVFHICANNETYDFLCPNGTIFHQEYLTCVWWNQFECNSAPSLYEINANIYDYTIFGHISGTGPSGKLVPTSFTGQGPSSGYPNTQELGIGGGLFRPQEASRPQGPIELERPDKPEGSVKPQGHEELQRPSGPQRLGGSVGYPHSEGPLPLELEKPSTGFRGADSPGTPSREYLPQVSSR